MKVNLQTVHVKVDGAFEDFLQEKLQKLEKFFFDEPSLHFIIKKERFKYIVEVDISSKAGSLFLKESSEDLNQAVENLINKLKNRLSRIHEKKIDLSHKQPDVIS